MFNKVILIGNLTADPELRYLPETGKALAKFTLAVARGFTNRQGEKETDFINISVWDKLAENSANYLKKGSKAAVEGRLQIRKYDDKEGIRRTAVEVVANRVIFLDSKRQAEGTGGGYTDNMGAETDIREDDVPF